MKLPAEVTVYEVGPRDGLLHEIKSALILQPGPAALTDGLNALVRIVDGWAASGSG